MQTSALSLQQILTVASSSKEPKAAFLQVLADHLALTGPDAHGQVISILLTKIEETKADIDLLPIDDAMKLHLQNQLSPFRSIHNLQHVHMNIEAAKNHFLKGDNVNGLMNIHLALTGHVERNNVERVEAETLAEKFRAIAKEIHAEDLPESLKRAFLKRALKMASILDHYYAFGPEDMQDELVGLVGALVVTAPKDGAASKGLYKKLTKLAVAGLVMLTGVDAGLGKVIAITDKSGKLSELFGDDEAED